MDLEMDMLEAMWDELEMLEETGDLDAQEAVFAKYHWNFLAAGSNADVHPAWSVV